MGFDLPGIAEGIGIGDDDVALVGRHAETIADLLPETVDVFYRHLLSSRADRHFDGVDLAFLKRRQIAHWRNLFEGRFDAVHENNSRKIGHVHHARGIGHALYMQAYGRFLTLLTARLAACEAVPSGDRHRLVNAVTKFVFFDMSVAMSVYAATFLD